MQFLATSWRSVRRFAGIASFLMLTACSGGGGGGGDSNTGDGFTVSATSLSFAAKQNGPLPPGQSIQTSFTHPEAVYVGAAYPPGATPASWLSVSPPTGSGNSWTFQFSVNTTNLSPGTYTTTIGLGIARADTSIIAYKYVDISYTVSGKLSVSPTALNFNYTIGDPAPPNVFINISGASATWTASADQSWVILGNASGAGPGTLSAGYNPAGLGVGTYNAVLTITETGTGDAATVNISLVIQAPALRAGPSNLSFSGINGASIPSSASIISMSNGAIVAWTATPGADWIVLNKNTGTTPDTLIVGVNPSAGSLASGTYNSTINLSASYGGGVLNQTLNVSLTLSPASLSVSPGTVTLGGDTGRDFSAIPVQFSINTGANSHPWNITLDSGGMNWLKSSSSSGNVSSSPVSISLDSDRTGVTGGSYTGSASISATINGDIITRTVPVTLNIESHKLLVADNGIALASMPALEKLSHTVQVTDNLGATTSWSATSNQPWLTVTPDGTTPSDLALNANPAGLTPDTVHYATVSITSSDTSIENTETVRVGLWVGSVTPSATTTITTTYTKIAADPIRPYVYLHNGGTDITVYNVYTSNVVTTITNVGAQLGDMTISHDGTTLYVVNKDTKAVVPINLDTNTASTSWSVYAPVGLGGGPYITYTRTNGFPAIITGYGNIHDAAQGNLTGASFVFNSPFGYHPMLAASLNGNRFCAINHGLSPYTVTCYSLGYTTVGGGQLLVGSGISGNWGVGSDGRDIALNIDGSRLYVAGVSRAPSSDSVDPLAVVVYDPNPAATTMPVVQYLATSAGAFPVALQVFPNGRIHIGANAWYEPKDVWIYNPNGTLITDYRVSGYAKGILERMLAVSGDGLRMITQSDDPKLQFTTASP